VVKLNIFYQIFIGKTKKVREIKNTEDKKIRTGRLNPIRHAFFIYIALTIAFFTLALIYGYDRMNMRVGKSVLLSLNLQLFYVDYTGEEDGLFIAPKLTSQIENIPVTLYFQAIQGIVSNMEPFPGFRWNLGAAYVF